MLDSEDVVRLQHMLDAAQEAQGFVKGKRRSNLENDRMLALSLIKEIEIIGEAASRITLSTREQCVDIPWMNVVSMRNRLIHGYFDIDLDRIWFTVAEDLPLLIEALQKILFVPSDDL